MWDGSRPLYLTLAGAEGRDIDQLVEAGLVEETETGGIAESSMTKVVAIESNAEAVLSLQRKFPALKILRDNLVSLLGGPTILAWPAPGNRHVYRALVVNLDFDGAFTASTVDGQLSIKEVELILKIAELHRDGEHRDWYLCLTGNAAMAWDPDVCEKVQNLLAENFSRVEEFGEAALGLMGKELYGSLVTGVAALPELPPEQRQSVLMALVPKMISHRAHVQGWRVETRRNLRYGVGQEAPMVTWILHFRWDERASAQPELVYSESLSTILTGAGAIAEDGSVP